MPYTADESVHGTLTDSTSVQTQTTMEVSARRQMVGFGLALAAVILWGSNAVIARHLALAGVSMSVLAFLRVVIGGSTLALWIAYAGQTKSQMARRTAGTRKTGALLRDGWVWAALLCYGGNMLVFHWALHYTSASVVMMLENTAPVVALFGGAWLFQERVSLRALVALVLALVGVVLVCGADVGLESAKDARWGNFLAVLAGLTWGGYTLACKGQARRDGCNGLNTYCGDSECGGTDRGGTDNGGADRGGTNRGGIDNATSGSVNSGIANSVNTLQDGLKSMAVILGGSTFLLLPLLSGTDANDWPASVEAWGWVLLLGVMHTALATVLWRLALAYIPAYTASILFLLTIVLTMANAALFLHEQVTLIMLLGGGCICGALLSVVRLPSPRNRRLSHLTKRDE